LPIDPILATVAQQQSTELDRRSTEVGRAPPRDEMALSRD